MNWDSVERRDIGEETFIQLLKSHKKDEMERYEEIISNQSKMMDQIEENEVESMRRHDETHHRIQNLSAAMASFMAKNDEFYAAIKRAFPKDTEGHPDYDGHRTAHLAWIKEDSDAMELKKYIKKVVLAAAATALVSWLWAVVWPAFIHGPK